MQRSGAMASVHRLALLRLLCAAAMAVLSLALQAAPLLAVYRWDAPNGPSNVDAFSQWLGTPADIGGAVAALCSQDAGWITGQTITADGGSSLMTTEVPLAFQQT